MTTAPLTNSKPPTRPWKDLGVWLFGVMALFTLFVSVGATLDGVRMFHDDGTTWGTIEVGYLSSIFAVFVLEMGAIGVKVITIAIPEWNKRLNALMAFLLAITTGFNYIKGYEVYNSQILSATSLYSWIRDQPVLMILMTIMAAAIYPGLLALFLTGFVARWKDVDKAWHVTNQERTTLAQRETELAQRETELNQERTRVALLEQDRTVALQRVSELEFAILEMRRFVDSMQAHPPLLQEPEEGKILILGKSYSLGDLEKAFGDKFSKSTIRRRLLEVAEEKGHGIGPEESEE